MVCKYERKVGCGDRVACTTRRGGAGDASDYRLARGACRELHGRRHPLAALERLRADYPVSVHGVGLSLGSAEALNNVICRVCKGS